MFIILIHFCSMYANYKGINCGLHDAVDKQILSRVHGQEASKVRKEKQEALDSQPDCLTPSGLYDKQQKEI